jgi:predicted metal-dependent hydrolase
LLKKETDLKTHVTVEDLKIQHLKTRLQRMISNLNKNIDERESSLGIKKDRSNLKEEKSSNSLLFQYSIDNSDLLKTPDLLKS